MTASRANGCRRRRRFGGSPAQRGAGAGRCRGRRAAGRAQDEGGHCWSSAAGRRTLRRHRVAQCCGGRGVHGQDHQPTGECACGSPGALACHRSERDGRLGPARRGGIPRAGRRLTWGRTPGRRIVGAVGTPLSRRGEPGVVRRVPMLTGARRAGEAGEVSAARRGGNVWKVCFQRGLESSLRGYFSFCLRRSRPGPSNLERGPGVSARREAGGVSSLLKAPDAPGLPNSWLALSLRFLFGPEGDFPACICAPALAPVLWEAPGRLGLTLPPRGTGA